MVTTIEAEIRVRRDAAAAFANTAGDDGEPFYEKDTKLFKIADGFTPVPDLDAAAFVDGETHQFSDLVRQRIAANLADKTTPEGAAVAASAPGAAGGSTHPASSKTGTSIVIDATQATTQVVTMTGTTTVSFGSAPASTGAFQSYLTLKQDSVGGRTVIWPAAILWPGASAPTLSTAANAVDRVQLTWDGVEWLGSMVGAAFSRISAATTRTVYTQSASSTVSSFATEGNVTMSGGVLTLTPPATAWAGGVKAFLATTDNLNGSSSTGTPAGTADLTATFTMELADQGQQYPLIVLRARSKTYTPPGGTPAIDDIWTTAPSVGQPKTGYFVQLSIAENLLSIWDAATGQQIGVNIPFTFPSRILAGKVVVSGKRLQLRLWTAGSTEPSTWAIDNASALYGQFDGGIGFVQGNGPAATSKPMKITNLLVSTPVVAMQPAVPAPSTDPAGFTRIYTENFDTPATTGTGTSSVSAKYGGSSLQLYNDEGVYWPRATTSVHDGVLDVNLPGDKGAAFVFGGTDIAYNRVGGYFAFRAMALDAIGNGTATMIWPSSRVQSDGVDRERWADGEIDYPESNFEDSPMVHHHRMIEGQESESENYNTAVSWRDWHVYAVKWYPPGKGPTPDTGNVEYFVDGVSVFNVVANVPTVAHRFMFQIGNYGQPGHFLVDWATMSSLN